MSKGWYDSYLAQVCVIEDLVRGRGRQVKPGREGARMGKGESLCWRLEGTTGTPKGPIQDYGQLGLRHRQPRRHAGKHSACLIMLSHRCDSYAPRSYGRHTCSCTSWRCWCNPSPTPRNLDLSQPERNTETITQTCGKNTETITQTARNPERY